MTAIPDTLSTYEQLDNSFGVVITVVSDWNQHPLILIITIISQSMEENTQLFIGIDSADIEPGTVIILNTLNKEWRPG